ncbi:hypothetical protein HQ585_12080 [candidate division KSB1 bacterium]|nr:hypothetical protein [candidate division KSB1 bacterium]
MSYQEKYDEIYNHTLNKECKADIVIIIQHFCFETGALGNQTIISRNPQDQKLREYYNFFNVVENDPELMSGYSQDDLNRSQFAFKYLKRAICERYRNLTYSKSNPKVLMNRKYLNRISRRHKETGHIASFNHFLNAFR